MNLFLYTPACAPRVLAAIAISMSLGAAVSAQEQAEAPQAASAAAVAAPSSIPSDVANAVVKVFSTMRYPDPSRPWTKQASSEITASGVVIEGKRILTNAHAVLLASQVQVRANQAGDKISATVVAVAPGIDLAILKLDDQSFFNAHAPIARGGFAAD
jgi:S1-C subfamily serine protease